MNANQLERARKCAEWAGARIGPATDGVRDHTALEYAAFREIQKPRNVGEPGTYWIRMEVLGYVVAACSSMTEELAADYILDAAERTVECSEELAKEEAVRG